MRSSLKTIISIGTIVPLAIGTTVASVNPSNEEANGPNVENIIYLIGDGMGPQQVSSAAYFLGEGYDYGTLTMDTFSSIGYARTHSLDNIVTDSAAAGTALSSGHKTDNDVVGMVPNEEGAYEPVKPITSFAQDLGMSTGLVSTTRITHATPASFASHVEDRGMEDEIATQMLDYDVDVLLGGGIEHFDAEERDDGRDLIEEAEGAGYELLYDRDELLQTEGDKLLGLFSTSHMAYELDRETTNQPSLAEMTNTAIEQLSKDDDGFFLMVEGGRIDHAGHDNLPAEMMTDTIAFDEAIEVALEYAKSDPNTLVVITADHGTGGLSLGLDGEYGFERDVLKNVTRSIDYMAEQLDDDNENLEEVLQAYAGIDDLTDEEADRILEDAETVEEGIARVISDRALVGWTTTGHTAVDVPVYAYGPTEEQYRATLDNTEIPKMMIDALHTVEEDNDITILNLEPTEDVTLQSGESVRIQFESEPGLDASFSIRAPLVNVPNAPTELPVTETEPGVYTAYWTATSNLQASRAEIEVTVIDSEGNTHSEIADGKLNINP
ncbi:alkaline phosphatase [Geomicrobium sp. JSM 1781026]|uniref:alkaline phosphatase n=1 Tax=Geomicrobium sp. JSM 1781026 TaxID=3344580 RepID=UPI0035BF7C99